MKTTTIKNGHRITVIKPDIRPSTKTAINTPVYESLVKKLGDPKNK